MSFMLVSLQLLTFLQSLITDVASISLSGPHTVGSWNRFFTLGSSVSSANPRTLPSLMLNLSMAPYPPYRWCSNKSFSIRLCRPSLPISIYSLDCDYDLKGLFLMSRTSPSPGAIHPATYRNPSLRLSRPR